MPRSSPALEVVLCAFRSPRYDDYKTPHGWTPTGLLPRSLVALAAAGALLGGVTVANAMSGPAGGKPTVVHQSEDTTTTTIAGSTTTMADKSTVDETTVESDDRGRRVRR